MADSKVDVLNLNIDIGQSKQQVNDLAKNLDTLSTSLDRVNSVTQNYIVGKGGVAAVSSEIVKGLTEEGNAIEITIAKNTKASGQNRNAYIKRIKYTNDLEGGLDAERKAQERLNKEIEKAAEAARKLEAADRKANEAISDRVAWENRLQAKLRERKQLDADIAAKQLRSTQAPAIGGGFVTQLGGVKNSFTSQGVVAIQRANLEIQRLFTNSGITEARLTQMFTAIKTGAASSLGTLTTEELKAEVAIRRLITAFENAETAGKRTTELMVTFRTALRLLVIQMAHLAISKITNAMMQATDQGKEWEIQLAQIQTITLDNAKSTQEWGAGLTKLSNEFGLDIITVTTAAYEALSNQIGKAGGLSVFLTDAFTLARTTGATAAQSVNILSSAINAYGTSSIQASRYSAVLFKIADLGRLRVGDLANTFGNTATLANNVGISIEEVGAALATLTIQGVRPDTSMTLLNNIMLKLLKPTKEMKSLFMEWGVASGEAAIGTFGFGGVLARLDKELQRGGVARLGEIVSDMRAIRGIVGVTGQAFGKFTEALDQMTGAQEDFDKAAKLTAETVANKLNKELTALHNLFVTDAAQRFNKIMVKSAEDMGGFANTIKSTVDSGLNLMDVFLKITAPTIGFLNVVDKSTNAMSVLLPTVAAGVIAYKGYGIAVGTVSTIHAALISRMAATGAATSSLTAFNRFLTGSTVAATAATTAFSIAQSTLAFGIPIVVGAIAYYISSYNNAANKLKTLATDIESTLNELATKSLQRLNAQIDKENQQFNRAIGERQKIFLQYAAAINAAFSDGLQDRVKRITSEIYQIQSQREFEFKLIGVEEAAEKLAIVKNRVQQLGEEIATLVKGGADMEIIEDRFKDMAKVAKEFTDEAVRGVDKLNKEIKKLQKDGANKALEHELDGLSDPKKIERLKQLTDQLRLAAEQDFKKGNFEAAANKLEEAEKLNEKLISISGRGERKGKGKVQGVDDAAAINAERVAVAVEQRKKLLEMATKGQETEEDIHNRTIKGIDSQVQKMMELNKATMEAKSAVKDLQKELEQLGKNKVEAETKRKELASSLMGKIDTFNAQLKAGVGVGSDSFSLGQEDIGSTAYKVKKIEENRKKYDLAAKNDTADAPRIAEELIKQQKELMAELVKVRPGARLAKTSTGKTLAEQYYDIKDTGEKFSATSNTVKTADTERERNLQQQEAFKSVLDTQVGAIRTIAGTIPGALEKFNQSFERPVTNFDSAVQRFEVAAQAMVKNYSDMRPNKANGGMLGFAGGAPLGRDNLTINAHSGEGIFSRESMRMFYPQYVTMNSGGAGAGGLMSNGPSINVGDIHMHMASNNTQTNINDFARQLKRAVRAGTAAIS